MDFERGRDPVKALDIGLTSDPEPGRKFLVRFRLMKSCPEYYPLQRMEREGRPIMATAIYIREMMYNPYTFAPVKSAICRIDGIEGLFSAFWDDDEKLWEISQ